MTRERGDTTGLSARYEIRVRGELGTAWSDWFAGPVEPGGDGGDTVMTGDLDQAALHAVLRRIRDLGLPLISMRRIEPDRAAPTEPNETQEDGS